MRFTTRLGIVALATPLVLGAQAPPGLAGPGPGQNPPAWGQRMGPRMGMQQRWGQRETTGRGMGHRDRDMNRFLQNPQVRERLKITPEQLAKIQAQHSAFAKAGIRGRADLQVKEMELGELMRADKPDRALIDKKLREVNDASFAMRKAAIDNQLAMRELFTPEQRQEMQKMRAEFRGRMMQHWMGGPRRGPSPMGPTRGQPPAQPPADNGF